MSKKKRIIIICIVAVLVIAGAGGAVAAVKFGGGDPVNVYSMSNVAMDSYWGDISETEGMVRTDNMQSVYISGTQRVVEVPVTEGQSVKKGDVIAVFDTTLSDIELERQRLNVEKTNLRLTNAKNELAVINGYVPYYPPEPEPEPEPEELPPMELPYKSGGQGTEEKPLIYLWNDDCWYTDGFINSILPMEKAPVEPEIPEVPDDSENTDTPEDTVNHTTTEGDSENSGEESQPEGYKETTVWVVFETREYDNIDGEIIKYWGIRFSRNIDGSYKFSVYEPSPDYNKSDEQEEETEPEIEYPVGPQYTASEIAQMKSEKQREIRDLELQLKVENVKYEKLKLEIENGVVTAKLDGVVKTVADPDESQMYGTPFIVVSGGGGYYIQGTIGELELDTVKIGQTVTVMSWMNNTEIEGQIVEISELPSTDGYYWSNGNQNISFYPFTVFVNEDAALQENEYVSIQYSPAESGSGVYLELPFVLTEESKSYVYVADENGKLEKREVGTGKTLWGSYIEITSGLTMDDFIAFPYGKDIKAGADTVEAGIEELYASNY